MHAPKNVITGVSALMLCLSITPNAARAQAVAIAEISGTVSDPSGSPIPRAAVRMTETEKQTVHSTLTDASGRYVLPNLPVGPYKLGIQASGFKDYVQSGIVLQVGNNIAINVTMQVGSVSETVEVM